MAGEAIISYLASIQAWVTIQDEFGLTGAQACRCMGPDPGRMLVLASPGGLEHFFAELNALGSSPDFGAVAAVAGAHGIEVVGPPIH